MKPISTFKFALVISISFSFAAIAQPSLGTGVLVEGPAAGSDSVVLAMANPIDAWTATANDAWLHLDVANQSGTGSTNVVFSYDANPGATRTNTLTIAGQTLTVTQAGSTYVAAPGPVTTLVSSGLNAPHGVAVDGAGNVYIADTTNNVIKKWTAANNTVTTLVAAGLNLPWGVAVDGAGNVYVADFSNSAIKKWTAADNTVSTLVTSSQPRTVAVDSAGNLYFPAVNVVKKWTAANGSVTTVASAGVDRVYGVAVDAAGSVYYNDYRIVGWIRKWGAASNTVSTLVTSGLSYGVAVDSARNVYFSDYYNNAVKAVPRAFVDATPKSEGPAPGADVLPVVLPATANLLAPFAPTSDQPWLTITGITNGVVSFAFAINTDGTNRTGHVTVLGQPIPVNQSAGGPVIITSQPASLVVCVGSPAVFSVTAVGDDLSYQWQVSQDGGNTFTNISATETNASFTNVAPTLADNGSQYQVIASAGGASITSSPPAVLTVTTDALASAGTNQVTCSTNCIQLNGSVGRGATGGQWTASGTGIFTPDATTLNAQYCPSAGDVRSGSVTLTLATSGQSAPCLGATAQVVETIMTAPTAGAGSNQAVCAGNCTQGLGGQIGGCATGGVWTTTGTGTFLPSATTLNASYCPSSADSAVGAVMLTLTSTGPCAPCSPATAQLRVVVDSPPTIVYPPANSTVYPGYPATLAVGATGTALTYQWQVSRDGGVTFTNISGTATNASYTTAPTTLADNGNRYRVLVAGACSPPMTSSPPAVLTVDLAAPTNGVPVITAHPQTRTTQPGVGVSFSVFAPNATSYQWRFNGVDLPGATRWTYQIANPQAGDRGYYLAIAKNVSGWAPSQKAYLAVVGDQGVVPFSNVGFAQMFYVPTNSVAELVVGPELDQMQPVPANPWAPNPQPSTAVITNGYYDYGDEVSVPTVSPGQTAYYRVDVSYTNSYGILTTRPASRVLTLVAGGGSYSTPSVSAIQFPGWFIGEGTEPVRYSSPATNQVHSPGETVTLTADYFSYLDFGYPHFQWRKDGAIIPGATNYTGGPESPPEAGYYHPFFTMTNVQASGAGNYDLVINGSYSYIDLNTSLSIQLTQAAITPPTLIGPTLMGDGSFQFAFSNNDPGATFTVLTTTNLALPLSNWTVVGPATSVAPDLFQFSTDTTNAPQGFYRVRSP